MRRYNGTGYRKTLDNLDAYFSKEAVPVGAIQYDSWWYYKGST